MEPAPRTNSGFNWMSGFYESGQIVEWRDNFLRKIGCIRGKVPISKVVSDGDVISYEFESSFLMQPQTEGVAVLFKYPEKTERLITLLMPEILSPVSYHGDIVGDIDPVENAVNLLQPELEILASKGYLEAPSPFPIKIIAPVNIGYHWKYSEINIERNVEGNFCVSGFVIDPLGGCKQLERDEDFAGIRFG